MHVDLPKTRLAEKTNEHLEVNEADMLATMKSTYVPVAAKKAHEKNFKTKLDNVTAQLEDLFF